MAVLHGWLIKGAKAAISLAVAFFSLIKCDTAGNKLGSFKVEISLANSCSKRLASKLWVFKSLLAKEEMVLCFLSHVKQDGKCPNLP